MKKLFPSKGVISNRESDKQNTQRHTHVGKVITKTMTKT